MPCAVLPLASAHNRSRARKKKSPSTVEIELYIAGGISSHIVDSRPDDATECIARSRFGISDSRSAGNDCRIAGNADDEATKFKFNSVSEEPHRIESTAN